jgi:AraC-like DNA-binding protein
MAFLYLDAVGPDLAGVLARARTRDAPDGALRAAYDVVHEAALVTLLDAALADAGADADGWLSVCWRLTDLLGLAHAGAAGTDARVAAAARRMRADPGGCPPLAALAAAAGLSPSRFAHRFTAAAGVPYRRYRLWCRMAAVARAAAGGASLTRAALDAGFASSAHLSAAFRVMFGLAPARLALGRVALVDLGPGNGREAEC